MFFKDSRPDRKKRAEKIEGRSVQLVNSPVPPAKDYVFFNSEELRAQSRTLIFDAESYINYWCVSFMCTETRKVVCFEQRPAGYYINNEPVMQNVWCQHLAFIMYRFRIVGFKSNDYDVPVCLIAVQGVYSPMLKQISNEIIKEEMRAYEIERKYMVSPRGLNHIDLIEVAPLKASLKMYAGRLHCNRMQDLPYPEDAELTFEQMLIVRDYNINDLDNTLLLWQHLEPQIKLREKLGAEYDCDLRSKSDAQLAETVIVKELGKLGITATSPDVEAGWQFNYDVPDFISFKTPQFQHALEVVRATPFVVGNSGSAECPQAIDDLKPRLGLCVYKMGVGGLHSSEESASYTADADTLLIDRDVGRYYPSIILNNELYPEQLGPPFLTVYNGIVTKRDMAKVVKDKTTDSSLKIVINGTFGKLGNFYSKIYAPKLLLQVCMTGQLSLMMLIEMIELADIRVISANTDGIVIRCPKNRYHDLETIIMIWENLTGFVTEETRYKGLYSRDINNYIAVKEEGGCKMKGYYSQVGSALNSPLSKNPECYIVSMALQAFLEHGTPIEETILSRGAGMKAEHYPTEISRFVSARTVNGGAEKDGVYLGKAVRWYYAKGETGSINYVLSGNQVPKTQGAKPLMILPEVLPNDLDFDYYINEANAELYKLGYYQRAKTGSLFEGI